MNPLDIDTLRGMISALQSALQGGFQTSISSPVDLLLESAIDLALILSTEFKEGAEFRLKNKGLKFLDRYSDPLGNPKQLAIKFPREVVWDPQAALFFKELASFLVRLKKGDSFKGAFMALVKNFPEFLQTPPVSPKGSKGTILEKRDARSKQRAYHRRQLKDK